jgi:hypothetical protein
MNDFIVKGWLIPNHVTTGDPTDKILSLVSSGNLTYAQFLKRMKKHYSGLEPENIDHVMDLFKRTVIETSIEGFSINLGLFRITLRAHGTVVNGQWDPEKNYISIDVIQGQEAREAIVGTRVEILGEKPDAIFIYNGEDAVTRATNGMATSGRNYILHGRMLKIAGTDPSVGITLTNQSTNSSVRIPEEMIVVNEPAKIILLLPDNLADGDYTLKVTTQYAGSGTILRKEPHSVETTISIGQSIGTLPETPGGGGGDGGGGIYIDPNA